MKTRDLLSLQPLDIESMTEKQLRRAVSTINATAKKRQARIEAKDEIYSPAVDYINRTGGFKSVRGQTKEELINSFMRGKSFLESETSTVKGSRAYTQQQWLNLSQQTGASIEDLQDWMTETQKTKFFQVLDMAVENKEIARGSEQFYRAWAILEQSISKGDKRRGAQYYHDELIKNLEAEYRASKSNLTSRNT